MHKKNKTHVNVIDPFLKTINNNTLSSTVIRFHCMMMIATTITKIFTIFIIIVIVTNNTGVSGGNCCDNGDILEFSSWSLDISLLTTTKLDTNILNNNNNNNNIYENDSTSFRTIKEEIIMRIRGGASSSSSSISTYNNNNNNNNNMIQKTSKLLLDNIIWHNNNNENDESLNDAERILIEHIHKEQQRINNKNNKNNNNKQQQRHRKGSNSKQKTIINFYQFHIHGWRWHTMSLLYETKRFHQYIKNSMMVQQSSSSSIELLSSLKHITNYVIGFNMKGLHRIENDIFFPWMRKKMKKVLLLNNNDSNIYQAFDKVMNQIEKEQRNIYTIGQQIINTIDMTCKNSNNLVTTRTNHNNYKSQIILLHNNLIKDTSIMIQYIQNILYKEEFILIPYIGLYISEYEQKQLNNHVIRHLGILNSRLHLVGMYEAIINQDNNNNEYQLFQKTIPSIPQRMIPRWKRSLYNQIYS